MPIDLNSRITSPADALEAVTQRVWEEYQRSGYLPEEWIEQIYRHGWRKGKIVDRETIRLTLQEALRKLHNEAGYDPVKAHRDKGEE
jgi:hypothetical protein